MPQTKFQDVVFTAIMAIAMVYGMICYNVAINMGTFTPMIFANALHELPIMASIAFVLEFFLVGKVAGFLAFRFLVTPQSKPLHITFAVSFFICLIMCPIMSGIATVLFNEASLMNFLMLYGRNIPMAFAWQFLVCGPIVRRVFRFLFRNQLKPAMNKVTA